MNADQVYQLQRDDAFAKQFSAEEYSTFVAMPFTNRNGYPVTRMKRLLREATAQASGLLKPLSDGRKRPRFAKLQPMNETISGAIDITNEIPSRILKSHFFFGDLTGCNFGVVLETGIALALKPNKRVILFTQDEIALLHFDLKPTNVNRYNEPTDEKVEQDFVKYLAKELVKAADQFEKEAGMYIRFLSSQLTPDAIRALKIYALRWVGWKSGMNQPSIWEDSAAKLDPDRFACSTGKIAFHNAVRELSDHRLFWTDYNPTNETYGIHATKLGKSVIERLWPALRLPQNTPTGPNLT